MFIVKQYNDDIEVYQDDILYLNVKRKFNILGKLFSTFMIANEVILESTYDIFFFKKFLSISNQNQSLKVELIKKSSEYYLLSEEHQLILRRHYFKNPLYTIEDNNYKVAEVSTSLHGFAEYPIIYNFTTECEKKLELLCLIRFLIEIPPTMDV
ncbi:MAG: hypothetical protein PSX81_16305 [bacterium]|nr:hypothetical protein [bacterium]